MWAALWGRVMEEQSATAMPQGMWKELSLWAALWGGVVQEETSAAAMPQAV